jgi:glycosyltransferase involved in cell wall biosynthesis
MPKISVVIPTYNRARFIAESIGSVLAQSFRDFEVIIIDDGSTDNTPEIVSAFPVRYFRQENQGPAGAVNKGIELSKGEYIAMPGSDDILLQNALEKGVEVLDKHPEAAFSYGQAYLMDEKGRIFGVEKGGSKHSCVREGKEEIRKFLISGNHIITSTVMVRRSSLEEVGLFDATFRSGSEDTDLWVRLAKRYAVAYIAEPLGKYRVHPQAMSAGRRVEEIERSNRRILEGIFNDAKVGPIFLPQRACIYSRFYLRLAGYAYGSGEMKTARSYLYKAPTAHLKGFLKGLWVPWIFRLAKTWIPLPLLAFARNLRRRLLMATLPRASLKGSGQDLAIS